MTDISGYTFTDPAAIITAATAEIKDTLDVEAYLAELQQYQEALALGYEQQFLDREQDYRILAANFGVRGLGDSGYAQRARDDFQQQQVINERALLNQYNAAATALDNQLARSQFDNQLALLQAAYASDPTISREDIAAILDIPLSEVPVSDNPPGDIGNVR